MGKDINRIKVILVEKKRTNKWLAEQLGKDPATVSKWCTNTIQPSLGTLLKINVHLYCEDDSVCIGVADNGPGIAEKDKTHIFERFYQVTQAQEKTGSGIGLHIANEYVLLHKGNISITDNFPQGAIFTVRLPIITGNGEAEETGGETQQQEENSGLPTNPITEIGRAHV